MCNLNIALKGSSMINMFNVSLGSTHTLFCEHNNTRIEDIMVKYFVHYVFIVFFSTLWQLQLHDFTGPRQSFIFWEII